MQGGIALQQIKRNGKRIGKKRGEFEVSRTNNHQQQERLACNIQNQVFVLAPLNILIKSNIEMDIYVHLTTIPISI